MGKGLESARARLLRLPLVLLGVTMAGFLLLQWLPGDPALALLGEAAAPADLAALRAELGLDRPLAERYLRWLAGALRGELGRSHSGGEPVLSVLIARIPTSLVLMLMAQLAALGLALPLALAAAARAGSWLDRSVSALGLALLSIPQFALGLLLILVFSIALGWLPATGLPPPGEGVTARLQALLLPALALGLTEAPVYLRSLRADLGEVLREPYVLAARAKGLAGHRVLLVHALRPASLSLVTLVGLNMGHLLGGAVVVETLFALPGVGRTLVEAVYARDLPLVQGCILFVALVYTLVNALVDLAYGRLDPRIRAG